MENEKILEIKDLHKEFGGNKILNGINCDVHKSEMVCIIGPSGSGKSTFLRCINLLEYPTSGEILYKGQKHNGIYCIKNRMQHGQMQCDTGAYRVYGYQ